MAVAPKVTIQNTFGIGAANGVKMLVYSRAGIGKTTLCATAPAPIILSAESGLLALSRWNLPYIEIRNIADLTNAFDWAQGSAEARQFQTLCLDSISEIGEVVLSNSKAQVKDPRQAYGELIDKMTMTIRAYRDLPRFNVYMSAKQEVMKDDSTGIVMNIPSMPGSKLGQQLPYFFDEVFQMEIGKDAMGQEFRYLRTQPSFNSVAKDRSGRLDAVEAPDLSNVIRKITQPTT